MTARLAVLLAGCLLAAGCTTTVAGAPSAPSTAAPPSRPREVRLDGVDPCSLLTPEQRAALGLESQPHASKPYVALFSGKIPTCTINGPYPDLDLLAVGTVTTVGIERWQGLDVAAETRQISVYGFPALVAVPRNFKDYCNVEIDVARGQLLDVQFGSSQRAPKTQPELCRQAERSAAEVMKTLLAR